MHPDSKLRPLPPRPESSAGRKCNTLVRINKKAVVPQLDIKPRFKVDDSQSHRTPVDLSNGTMKRVLGKLYTDKEYLQQLKETINRESTTFKDPKIAALADSGLNFLKERGEYWDNLGPLPPLVLKKQQGQRKANTLTGSLFSLNGSESTQTTTHTNYTWPTKTSKQKEKEVDPNELLHFDFQSYRPNSRNHRGHQQNVPEKHPRKAGEKLQIVRECTEEQIQKANEERQAQISLYFEKALEDIDREFKEQYFESCEQRVLSCLENLKNFKDGHADMIRGVEVRLFNYLGDINAQREKYDSAMMYYQTALSKSGPREKFSILDNIGQLYSIKEHHNKALEIFSEQARFATSSDDMATAFLNLGNSFMALNHYEYARDCGKKCLHAARKAGNRHDETESSLLLALSLAYLNKHKEARRKISQAKQLAQTLGDRELIELVQAAEGDVQTIIRRCRGSAGQKSRRTSQKSHLTNLTMYSRATLINTPA